MNSELNNKIMKQLKVVKRCNIEYLYMHLMLNTRSEIDAAIKELKTQNKLQIKYRIWDQEAEVRFTYDNYQDIPFDEELENPETGDACYLADSGSVETWIYLK